MASIFSQNWLLAPITDVSSSRALIMRSCFFLSVCKAYRTKIRTR